MSDMIKSAVRSYRAAHRACADADAAVARRESSLGDEWDYKELADLRVRAQVARFLRIQAGEALLAAALDIEEA